MINIPSETTTLNLGDDATQLVSALPALLPALASVVFHTYFPGLGLEERLAASKESDLRDVARRADELREISGTDLPYWESIVAASWSTSNPTLLLDQALSHDATREQTTRFEVPATELSASRIERDINSLPADWVLALCSTCKRSDGSDAHLPMMDFRCPPNPTNLERIKLAVQKLGQTSGAILYSGRSYHFYGFDLLDQKQWIDFMARSLLLAPLVDARYVAHRLIERTAVLRMTASQRKPRVPTIVAVLGT